MRKLSALASYTILIGLLSFLSCFKTSEEFCKTQSSRIEKEIASAFQELTDSVQSQKNTRMLASSQSEKDWKKWSLSHLREIEGYIDTVPPRSALREARFELSKVAELWVEFYGYATLENKEKMALTLQTIQERQQKAKKVICELNSGLR
jgi:hypothetical protein